MYLRKAAVSLLRRVRLPSHSISTSFSPPTTSMATATPLPFSLSRKIQFPNQFGNGSSWSTTYADPPIWTILSIQAAIILGINVHPVFADDGSNETNTESDVQGVNISGLRKIEDGSVISNGKLEEAEKFFLSAIQEAKEGFGERDPHVASACNNLAELYRVKKAFDKAEPLYLDAIRILEEAFGSEDIRSCPAQSRAVLSCPEKVGGGSGVLRELCYKMVQIKGRVLGRGSADYADTMYHLGTVLFLQGRLNDSEVVIQDSIRVLEESGQGESMACIRRLRYLAQIYIKSNRISEAENIERKVLHIMELSKGWNSLDTVVAAEGLGLTLQSSGSLKEAQELLERCLDARKTLLPEDHIQIGANMLHIARVVMLNYNQLRGMHVSDAIAELDKAKGLLNNAIRIARKVISKSKTQNKKQGYGVSGETRRDVYAAVIILLQSLNELGLLEINRQELQESGEKLSSTPEVKNAHFECISAYKELATERLIGDSTQVKAEYLSCLKHLSSLLDAEGTTEYRGTTLQELKDEIKRVEDDISQSRRHKS
ncbi:kinesin light chain 3 isoform X1 [Gossypium australe]|uniref:Kinesin light chain 3 isoform X1 n=1 Tax=Gossypium australe TaxID=47621 RepID=A0A5B6UJS3_9ROSI|nr:kinesin light chain 3 isoform X1 [Gossypium australe]